MNATTILQVFLAILPAIVVGLVAYYFFNTFTRNEENRRRYQLRKQTEKELTPHRLQALERMTLFLERISPGRLLLRVKPTGNDKFTYENKLINTIEQEFEHNLAQQIYVSESCWNAIQATKNATITLIRKSNMSESVDTADKLREVILTELLDHTPPSETGLAYVREEAQQMWA